MEIFHSYVNLPEGIAYSAINSLAYSANVTQKTIDIHKILYTFILYLFHKSSTHSIFHGYPCNPRIKRKIVNASHHQRSTFHSGVCTPMKLTHCHASLFEKGLFRRSNGNHLRSFLPGQRNSLPHRNFLNWDTRY